MLPRRAFLGLRLRGRSVDAVWPGSAAASAGIAVGDRVATIDGASAIDLAATLAGRRVGDTIRITLDDGRSHAIVLEPWPLEETAGAATIHAHIVVAGARLRTIVTVPHAVSGAPAVLLLPGLSLVSMDHPEHAWRSVVVGLAAAGVVSMRVDRRGLGDSEGGPAEGVDFDTELAGYATAAETLRGRPEVDPDRVAIFGHSIGAMQAPLVAADVPVRSIVAYGTTVRRFSDHMIPNARRQLALRGLSGDALTRAMAAEIELADAIAGDDPHAPTQAYGRCMTYLRQLDRTDIAHAWSRYEGDVLLLHGEHDVVTDADDHRALADLLRARVRGSVELHRLSSLGHTMLRVPNPRADLEHPHDGEPTDLVAEALATFVSR